MTEEKIIKHLSKDKKLKTVIDSTTITYGRYDIDDVYFALLRAIVSQQLSAKAAQTIFARFIQLFEDDYPLPEDLMHMDFASLRGVGLSKQKVGYVQNVAQFFDEKKLLEYDWSAHTDQEIIDMLTEIKGVGVWTVQMILIFSLHRLDVFPVGDLVVRQNVMKLYKVDDTLKGKPLIKHLNKIAEKWSPYRSVAARYFWQWNR